MKFSLLPNLPCLNGEELHEKGIPRLSFSLLYHLEKISCEIPINSKVLPTSLAKGTAEEKMENSFFNVVTAENTVIVISFKLLLFSFQNISCVQSVHEEQP
jgi:hypothetical protein